jgi:hypothetical protein
VDFTNQEIVHLNLHICNISHMWRLRLTDMMAMLSLFSWKMI